MIVAFDVAYEADAVVVAAVLFPAWDARQHQERVKRLPVAPADYVPGSFALRELPPILALLADLAPDAVQPSTLVVDGHAWLAPGRPCLGARLHEATGLPVVGIAKTPFAGSPHAEQVLRGGSKRPLYVTAAGLDAQEAARGVAAMAGPHRLPELLKRVDALARGRA
jgi:deoxyribonuclease V